MAGIEITMAAFVMVSILCSPFAYWAYEAWNEGKSIKLMNHWNKW